MRLEEIIDQMKIMLLLLFRCDKEVPWEKYVFFLANQKTLHIKGCKKSSYLTRLSVSQVIIIWLSSSDAKKDLSYLSDASQILFCPMFHLKSDSILY